MDGGEGAQKEAHTTLKGGSAGGPCSCCTRAHRTHRAARSLPASDQPQRQHSDRLFHLRAPSSTHIYPAAMQSIARRAGSAPLLRRSMAASALPVASASAARRLLHSNSSWRLSADKKPAAASSTPSATSAAIAAAVPHSSHKTVGNSAADLRRIFREQQRANLVSSEAFPWEITQQKVTGTTQTRQ